MTLPDLDLDLPADDFKRSLYRMSDIIHEASMTMEERKVLAGLSPREVSELIREPMPTASGSFDALFDDLQHKVIPNATFNAGPYCNSYVLSCGNQAGVFAEMLAAFLNQNCGKWHLSAIGAEMEKLVIEWISAFVGLPSSHTGLLVSGGSMANLSCLAVARNNWLQSVRRDGLFGQVPLLTYVSTEVHHCVIKACEFLGLGHRNLRRIPVDSEYRMDCAQLAAQIEEDRWNGLAPFCVVASAGTVNTGAVDDLQAVGRICREHDLWFHVDGAYGAAAAGTERCRELFRGLETADSLAIDPHKWNYVPIEAGCALFRNPRHSKTAFSHVPDYLAADQRDDRLDFMEHGMQLSRGFRSLKIWMTFKAYGADKLKAAIEHDILKADYLASLIDAADDFELIERGPLSVVCFRFNPAGRMPDRQSLDEQELAELNHRLIAAIEADGRTLITGTKLHGRTALRVCFTNHRAQQRHVDRMFDVLREIADLVALPSYQQSEAVG